MPNLNKQVNYVCGVVNFARYTAEDGSMLMDQMLKIPQEYNRITNYYFIGHDETDTFHIHFIFYSKGQTLVSTFFNKIFDTMKKFIIDEYSIQIDKCNSINAHLRYILHQDKESISQGKKKYEIDSIISDNEQEIIETMINSVKGEIDAYYLRNCILDSENEFELMNKLGLKVYHRYRYEIDILKENRVLLARMREEEMNNRKIDEFNNMQRELPF